MCQIRMKYRSFDQKDCVDLSLGLFQHYRNCRDIFNVHSLQCKTEIYSIILLYLQLRLNMSPT